MLCQSIYNTSGGQQSLVSLHVDHFGGISGNDTSDRKNSANELRRKLSASSKTHQSLQKNNSQIIDEEPHKDPDKPLEKVILNVGGRPFCTFKETLGSVPRTRLCELMKYPVEGIHPDHYDPTSNQYFFDRHPGIFEYILNYYRTGELHVPRDVCWPIFNNELAFWGLDHTHLESCCWQIYRSHEDHENTLKALDEEDKQDHSNDPRITDPNSSACSRRLAQLWELCDDPMSSQMAKVFALLSLTLILASVALFCLETHEYFLDFSYMSVNMTLKNGSVRLVQKKIGEPKQYLWYIEAVCVAWFCFEIILRFISCPDKCQFAKSALNIIDFLAVLPFFFSFVENSGGGGESQAAGILRVVRILRVFRVFKLTRHSTGLKILWHTLHASLKELAILGIFMCLGVVIFASLIYYAERLFATHDHELVTDFKDIPHGFWWALVTMTTLGYGDMVPRTFAGQIVGSLCALCGLLTIALPVPVIVSNFSLYYSHYQAKNKLPKNRDREQKEGTSSEDGDTENNQPILRRISDAVNISNLVKRSRKRTIDSDVEEEKVPQYLQTGNLDFSLTPNPPDWAHHKHHLASSSPTFPHLGNQLSNHNMGSPNKTQNNYVNCLPPSPNPSTQNDKEPIGEIPNTDFSTRKFPTIDEMPVNNDGDKSVC